MESLEGLWILERYHESQNDTNKLETTLQASTLWILKSWNDIHETWNKKTRNDIMNFETTNPWNDTM